MEYTSFICIFGQTFDMNNNITYSLSFKILNESITFKKDSPALHIGDVMLMYKSLIITLFGEDAYRNAIINEVDKILLFENDSEIDS